jgi:hypothetical protein
MTAIGAALALTALRRGTRAQGAEGRDVEPIAVLGSGHLGSVLGKRWGKVGHPILYGSRTPADARVQALVKDSGPQASALTLEGAAGKANVLVFALPWKAVPDLVPTLGDLSGKIIIDPMNALQMVDHYPLPELQTSVGEHLQALVPKAHVVKAFNTIAAPTMSNPQRLGGPITIGLAGEDAAAKARVAALVAQLDVEPVDTGPLIASRYLEGMMLLSFGYYLHTKKAFEFYLRPVPA